MVISKLTAALAKARTSGKGGLPILLTFSMVSFHLSQKCLLIFKAGVSVQNVKRNAVEDIFFHRVDKVQHYEPICSKNMDCTRYDC